MVLGRFAGSVGRFALRGCNAIAGAAGWCDALLRKCSVLVIAIVLLGVPSVASAVAMAVVSAAFDWTSFRLTLQGVTLRYAEQQNHTYSLVQGDGIPAGSGRIVETTPWSNSPVVNTTHFVQGTGVGEISSSTVRAAADAFASKPSGVNWVDASGRAYRMARFTVSGEGSVMITASYSLNLTGLGADEECESASVFAEALLTLYNTTLDQQGQARDYMSRSVEGGSWVDPYSETGTLTVSLAFHDGDVGQMQIESIAVADAHAPLAPTWVLLGAGLAGFGFIRRRRV